MSIQPATRPSNQPRSSGDLRRRLLRHHVPLALASAVVLVLFMSLPRFDASKYKQGDIFSGAFPRDFPGAQTGPMQDGAGQTGPMDHRVGQIPSQQDGGHQIPQQHGGGQTSSLTPTPEEVEDRSFMRRLTTATGYVALALLAITLLIGPANLLLRRRNPVSSYLRRDMGAWAAIFSVVHLIPGLQVHGTGQILDFLDYFIAPDGSPLSNSFGLGNYTGLAALVIVAGLLALSSDAALRKLKAKPWKRLQRLNYVLIGLVIVHSFLYGALLRVTSPYTILLGLSIIAVVVGQAMGVRLWRRRYSPNSRVSVSGSLWALIGGVHAPGRAGSFCQALLADSRLEGGGKLKKLTALLLAASALGIAGCGGDDESAEPAAGEQPTAASGQVTFDRAFIWFLTIRRRSRWRVKRKRPGSPSLS